MIATAICPRCGQPVSTWHPKPECDAYYDKAYRRAANDLETVKTEQQYGVRYGDGEVEGPLRDEVTAGERITNLRWHLANDPDYSEDDYEPLSLVKRTHVVQTSPWMEVR